MRGNDEISGGKGDDVVYGNSGNDVLSGDDGNDTIYGGKNNDTISDGEGNDTVFGDSGNDMIIAGEAGRDSYTGGSGFDTLDYSNSTTGDLSIDLSKGTVKGAGHEPHREQWWPVRACVCPPRTRYSGMPKSARPAC